MTKPFIAVMIVPTGIGCSIGGHAGDANPAAKLLASVCDKLIVHPNVVNASDINEMTENMLYVEGSMLDRFLEGEIALREVRSNKILVAVNSPVRNETINSVSAARATLGADIEMMVLEKGLIMRGGIDGNGNAKGFVGGIDDLVCQIQDYEFDALAITTQIEVLKEVTLGYWAQGGVNPWGYVEAQLSKQISGRIGKPVAHSPEECDWVVAENYKPKVIDPRMSAEAVSVSYLHCILKGLHKAPRVGIPFADGDLRMQDVDCLVSPYGVIGRPHRACHEAHVPMIVVEENDVVGGMAYAYEQFGGYVVVESYMEAVGYIQAMKIGIMRESVSRPLKDTVIYNGNFNSLMKGEKENVESKDSIYTGVVN